MKGIKGIEARANTAARRFSKGIVSRIIHGRDLVSFIQYNSLVPSGITFEDRELAFSMHKSVAFVIPLYNLPDLYSISEKAGVSAIIGAAQDAVLTQDFTSGNGQPEGGIHRLEAKLKREESLLYFLKQNLVMAFINQEILPKGIPELLKKTDILIDNTDTLQAVVGEVVLRNNLYPNDRKQWNK
jgi:hypothetical protein